MNSFEVKVKRGKIYRKDIPWYGGEIICVYIATKNNVSNSIFTINVMECTIFLDAHVSCYEIDFRPYAMLVVSTFKYFYQYSTRVKLLDLKIKY